MVWPRRDRYPLVTIGILDGQGPNLGGRLLEVAALDYAGPIQVFVVGKTPLDPRREPFIEFSWAMPLSQCAEGGAAVGVVAREGAGEYIALLPAVAHPHSLWLDELVAIAVEHEECAAVAPVLARPSGVVAAMGATLGADRTWSGMEAPEAKDVDEFEIDAAFGDGILLVRDALREIGQIDAELDLRAFGIDFSLRARARGRRIFAAKRSTITVARDANGRATRVLSLPPKSDLLLIASHNPESLPAALANFEEFASRDEIESETILPEVCRRAGIDISKNASDLFSRALAESSRARHLKIEELNQLHGTIAELEKARHDAAVVMHREMAWAHTLASKLHNAEVAMQSETSKLARELEKLRAASLAERERLEQELAESRHQLSMAAERVELLEKSEQGREVREALAQDLERRWRDAEARREAALRDLGSAQERIRILEELRTTLDARQKEEHGRAERYEKEVRELLDRAARLEVEKRDLGAAVEAKTRALEEKQQKNDDLVARLAKAEKAYDAASALLKAHEQEFEQLRSTVADLDARRKAAERGLSDAQTSLESSRRALNELTSELGLERRRRSDESLRTVKEIEKANQLIGELQDQVAVLTERSAAAEGLASELRVELAQATQRAETAESREEALSADLRGARDLAKTLQTQVGTLEYDRQQLQESVEEFRARLAALDTAHRALQKERGQLKETLQQRDATIQTQTAGLRENAQTIDRLREQALAADAELARLKKAKADELAAARGRIAELEVHSTRLASDLAAERAHAHRLAERIVVLEGQLAATARRLDESRSVHAERVADLARLRTQTLAERDALLSRLVSLLEEVRRPRFFGRAYTDEERSLLTGPGAGFVTKPVR
jgi:chromosome segregation ATPase